jgi:glutathione synthase/RimK-type ligase-like ATP-grasp enzyme
MTTIALATYAALPELAPDDQLLIGALDVHGVRASPTVWDDPSVDWSAFDAVVIRSCWDYHLRNDAFFAWIDRVSTLGVPIWNPPAMLRWNSRKTYLHDLTIAGVRTVPTLWLAGDGARRSDMSLDKIMTESGSHVAVVKPVVSASAHDTYKVTQDDARANATEHDARLREIAERDGAMVQPFIPQIAQNGEWSLLFFGGVFSHAVLKRAAPGDFRVQREFGGTHELVTPTPRVLGQAEDALRAAPGESVYARVDGYLLDEDFILTELELLEPSLFLEVHPEAPARFAAALMARMGISRGQVR